MSVARALRRIADRSTLTVEESRDAFFDLMEGRASETQKGALLLGLAARGETAEELAGAVTAVREKMLRASSRDTVRSRARTGKPARQLRTAWHDAWEGPDSPGTPA